MFRFLKEILEQLQQEPPLTRLIFTPFALLLIISIFGSVVYAILLFSAAVDAISNSIPYIKTTYTSFVQYFTRHPRLAVLVIFIGLSLRCGGRDDH